MRTLLNSMVLVWTLVLLLHARGAPGDLDMTFDPGSGIDSYVNAVAVQPDGNVIIGGQFTTVAGLVRHGIARLNPDGTGDASFNPGAGLSYAIEPTVFASSVVLQPDGKVLIAGSFMEMNGLGRD